MVPASDKTLTEYLGDDEKLLLTLEEVVNPKHTALIVVDMQNDFVHGRGKTQPSQGNPLNPMEEMTPHLLTFIKICRKVSVPVFWIVTYHGRDIDLPAYKARMARRGEGPICIEGTKGAEIISELGPQKEERVFVKHGYDGFTGNDLDICLKNKEIVSLIMSGTATNTCVDATLKHGFHLGYYIVVGSDITSTLTEGAQDMYLKSFSRHYALIATSKEVANIWGIESDQGVISKIRL